MAAVATKRQHQNSRGQKITSSITNVLAVAVTRFERIPLTLAFLMSAVSHWMLNGTTSALLAELVLEDWTRDIPGTLTVGCCGKTDLAGKAASGPKHARDPRVRAARAAGAGERISPRPGEVEVSEEEMPPAPSTPAGSEMDVAPAPSAPYTPDFGDDDLVPPGMGQAESDPLDDIVPPGIGQSESDPLDDVAPTDLEDGGPNEPVPENKLVERLRKG